jgi:hypothetical protein
VRLKALELENRELRHPNEVLRNAPSLPEPVRFESRRHAGTAIYA